MTAAVRFRDTIRKYIPPWLSDRYTAGKTVGYRLLWSMIAPLDGAADVLVQGLQAPLPNVGTPTALPYIGRTRGILRGQADSDEEYGARLRTWLDRWRSAGSAEALAREIQEYLGNTPKVRIITRGGYWITRETDGTITRDVAPWDWDSVSNPERAGYWSELFIVVYPTQWSTSGPFLETTGGPRWGEDGLGIGHDASREEYDAIRGLLAQWKSAHTKIRAVIWTSDAALFDPSTPASCPDGTWGTWGSGGNGSRVASGRDLVSCRYWEM